MAEDGAAQIATALSRFLTRDGAGSSVGRVYLAGGATSPPQLAYLVHFPRLSVVLSGKDKTEIEQNGLATEVVMTRGQAVFVPANCWNRPAWAGRAAVLNVLFGKRQTGISLVNQSGPGKSVVTYKTHFQQRGDGPVQGILAALGALNATVKTRAAGDATDRLLIEALLHSCLQMLREPSPQSGGKADKTFQSLCLYLQENFQFPLTRDSVADHFRLSPNHVSRVFRSEGLMRFTDYLTSVRMDRAKYLLKNHDRTLAEVARSCGFADVGYFCRVFKLRTKLTPTEYRSR